MNEFTIRTLCGCEVEIDAAYNWMDGRVEIEGVSITKHCDDPELTRLRADNAKLRAALDRVASTGCDNFTRGDCWENGYDPDDDLGAYRVCDPCLAARALEETK